MTKKQLSALKRILKREANGRFVSPRRAGIHKSGGYYAVSDGCVAVLMDDKPLGFDDGDESVVYSKYGDELKNSRECWATTEPVDIDAWKSMLKESKDACLRIYAEGHEEVWGNYSVRLLIDAVEAVDTSAIMNISKGKGYKHPCVLFMPRDWMERDDELFSFVLPVVKKEESK